MNNFGDPARIFRGSLGRLGSREGGAIRFTLGRGPCRAPRPRRIECLCFGRLAPQSHVLISGSHATADCRAKQPQKLTRSRGELLWNGCEAKYLLSGTTRVMRTIVCILLVTAGTIANAAERSHYTRDFALKLEPIVSQIRTGAVPSFRLTLTNISDHTCRILNVDSRRVELQHTYYDLVIWKDGKKLWVPRAISDPGPISDRDWLEVARGATKSFLLTNFPQNLESLRAGNYEGSIRFWRDPHTSHSNAYDSPKAKFTVTE